MSGNLRKISHRTIHPNTPCPSYQRIPMANFASTLETRSLSHGVLRMVIQGVIGLGCRTDLSFSPCTYPSSDCPLAMLVAGCQLARDDQEHPLAWSVGVRSQEWDGDIPVSRTVTPESDDDCGEVVFKASTLPWEVGTYEVRSCCEVYFEEKSERIVSPVDSLPP